MSNTKLRPWLVAALLGLCLSAVYAADKPLLKDNAREYLALRSTLHAATLTLTQASGPRSGLRGKSVEVYGRILGRTNVSSTISVMLVDAGCTDTVVVDATEDNPLLAVDQVVHVLADLPDAARPTDHFILRALISEDDLPAAEQRYAAAEAETNRAGAVNHTAGTASVPAPPSAKNDKPSTPTVAAPQAPAPPQPSTQTVVRPGTQRPGDNQGPQLNASTAKAVGAWKAWISKINPKLSDSQLETIVRSVLYYSALYGMDHRLAFAMIKCESDYDPRCLSHSGAMGLCQLMPFNAKDYGVDPWDLEQNINGGLHELSGHLHKFADKSNYDQCILGLACYNAGPGAVKRAGNAVPNITETIHYVKRVGDLFYDLWKSGMP